jgi:hypothetical protein
VTVKCEIGKYTRKDRRQDKTGLIYSLLDCGASRRRWTGTEVPCSDWSRDLIRRVTSRVISRVIILSRAVVAETCEDATVRPAACGPPGPFLKWAGVLSPSRTSGQPRLSRPVLFLKRERRRRTRHPSTGSGSDSRHVTSLAVRQPVFPPSQTRGGRFFSESRIAKRLAALHHALSWPPFPSPPPVSYRDFQPSLVRVVQDSDAARLPVGPHCARPDTARPKGARAVAESSRGMLWLQAAPCGGREGWRETMLC